MRRFRGDRGAVALEFALCFPVLMTMLVGGITSGLVLSNRMLMEHGAREGARYGATLAWDQEFESGTWASNAHDLVLERIGGDVADSICVALVEGVPPVPVSPDHTTQPDGTACWNDGSADAGSRVQVELTGEGRIDAVLFTADVDLNARAVAHSERQQPEDVL